MKTIISDSRPSSNETKFNKVYKSNTYLMIEKYEDIYSVLAELATN